MQQDEMQKLVDKLATERQQHIDKIDSLNLKDIKEIVFILP